MQQKTLLDDRKIDITIKRLCRQLIENHDDFANSVLIGIQPRGIYLANRIQKELEQILGDKKILKGN
ncbi:MAG: bifunctional pyr operon transcriptional regulator/uracil phosphoribosyltransferase PyrR, partial [Pedobacter sp.]|nr:bifunctional pyr operon transcriptional regulator/uracil phosphoribosyltransferase PyrR [Pedobacter sp.]